MKQSFLWVKTYLLMFILIGFDLWLNGLLLKK